MDDARLKQLLPLAEADPHLFRNVLHSHARGVPAMLHWSAASPGRTLQLVVHHTDGDREYAYDRNPILGSGTDQILAGATEHKWTVIDMAADWATIHPPTS